MLRHLGEGIPYWLGRIDNRYQAQVLAGANSALELLPSEYFRRNVVITTSGMATAPPLRLALDALGVERIQFAGDYPYEDVRAGVDFIEAAGLSAAERSAIFDTNATAYWGLSLTGAS